MGSGDGKVHYRDSIAIAEVILFAVSFFCAVYMKCTRRIGWFCIGGFSIIRCVGAGCLLGTINNDSDGLWTSVSICESMGVLLLIFTLLEMLEKINRYVPTVKKQIFLIPQVLTWISIGISIGGFIAASRKANAKAEANPSAPGELMPQLAQQLAPELKPTPFTQAGLAITCVTYLFTVCLALYFLFNRGHYSLVEHWLLMCVFVCTPLLLIRLLYALLFIITADRKYNAVKGDPGIYLGMTFLPEFTFVGLCCFIIVCLRPKGGWDAHEREGELRLGERMDWEIKHAPSPQLPHTPPLEGERRGDGLGLEDGGYHGNGIQGNGFQSVFGQNGGLEEGESWSEISLEDEKKENVFKRMARRLTNGTPKSPRV